MTNADMDPHTNTHTHTHTHANIPEQQQNYDNMSLSGSYGEQWPPVAAPKF